MRESAINILKEQGYIVYESIGSSIIFIGDKKKPSNPLRVLYNVANVKVECQTDSCFRYKSFKCFNYNVAVVLHLRCKSQR